MEELQFDWVVKRFVIKDRRSRVRKEQMSHTVSDGDNFGVTSKIEFVNRSVSLSRMNS